MLLLNSCINLNNYNQVKKYIKKYFIPHVLCHNHKLIKLYQVKNKLFNCKIF